MKIRSKLLLSFIVIACFSTLLATFFAIYSISQNYTNIAIGETVSTKKSAESFFYDYLGELTRKAMFISELSEIVNNINNPEELFIALENKSFFLFNINIKIIGPDLRIVASFNNSSESSINQKNLKKIPFFAEERDPLLRDTGIFKIGEQIIMLTISPIVDQNTFDFKGFVFFELYLNSEFVDLLKDKTKSDIIIISLKENLASSFQDSEGKRFFPQIPEDSDSNVRKLQISDKNFLIDGFPISDYYEKNIGKIYVAVNIKDIINAKKHGIQNILKVLLIVILLVIIISILIGRRLTNPILALSRGAESISKGEFDIQIAPPKKDEIGDLSKIFIDMSESLKAQREEILDLKLFFEKIIDNSPSAIIICDEMGGLITINPAAERIFNINIGDTKGKEIFEVINFSPSVRADFYKVIFSGNPSFHDSCPFFLMNEEKIFRLTLYKILLKKRISVAIQIEDITERLKMEEELTHAKKLATLGEVLSRYTHEFNNLLAGIVGHISLLKLEINEDEISYSRIISLEDLALKANNLSKSILGFSKKEKLETEKINIEELIDSVLILIEKTVLKHVDINRNYSRGPFYIKVNKEKFSLALFNLFINAKDAIKEAGVEDGRISITLGRFYKKDKKERFVKIQINDNGIGIDEKKLNKIFVPYFTTKGKSGTGLGLSTVKQVVEESKGIVSVESKLNVGTTFTFQFPESK